MWRQIYDFPNYIVSDTGQIKSVRRTITDKVGHTYDIGGKLLKPTDAGRGYPCVSLRKNGVTYRQYVHIIVAQTFIPNPKGLPVVNHQDGNKHNNNVSNLEWATYSDNNQHAYDNGLKQHGENFYNAKLTESAVREIKLNGKYTSFQALADKYGVAKATIRDVLIGKTWKNVS